MNKYSSSFSIEVKKSKEYFSYFVSSLLYIPISILIYYFLFRYILQSGTGFSMSLQEILLYYAIVLFIKSTLSHSMAEVYYVFQDINKGNLDLWLTRPVYYPFVRYFRALGSVSITIPSGLLFLLVLFWGRFAMGNILLFLVSVFLGFSLLFFVMFLLGSLTFWLKSVLSLRDVFWYVLSFFSGEMIPLHLFPSSMQVLANNPLASVYYLPSQVLQSDNPLPILMTQLAYVAIFFVISLMVWKWGLQHYESQGG